MVLFTKMCDRHAKNSILDNTNDRDLMKWKLSKDINENTTQSRDKIKNKELRRHGG